MKTLEQKKLIACAELDDDIEGDCQCAFIHHALHQKEECKNWWKAHWKPYATSLDAIVPVVVKWCGEDNERWFKFRDALEVGESSMMIIQYYLSALPSQILDALLLAAGKMPKE